MAERAESLRTMQREVFAVAPLEVASLDEAIAAGGALAGWRLSHRLVVLAGSGGVAVDNLQATPPMPPLLLYAPSAASAPADWLDVDRPDGPYRLIGWGYFAPYRPGSDPPQRACIAADEWVVHEAGWHLQDGGMRLTPGQTGEPAPPDVPVLFWHPRVWDLHVWAGEDGTPTIAFENPSARAGGVHLPEGAFLRRIEGELVPIANQPRVSRP